MEQSLVVKFFQQDNVKQRFNEILGKRGNAFTSSVLALINQNRQLEKCKPESVYMCAMMAATLDLPINANLGFAYIIGYGDTATFQMGYKGFIQLAMRSGQFKTISACPIYSGQLKSQNPLTGYEFDFNIVPNGQPVGYAAYFSLINGFEKTSYMSLEQVTGHAKRFSKTFNNGPWKTDFESMALKTVLKLLLGKYAPLSVEMQQAIISDQGAIKNVESLEVDYIDLKEAETETTITPEEIETAEIALKLCETIDELQKEWAKIDLKVAAVESVLALKNKLAKELKVKK